MSSVGFSSGIRANKLKSQGSPRPLCVDLDDTLVATDTLLESLLALLRHRPLYVLLLPWWLIRRRSAFKRRVAEVAPLEVSTLPYRHDFLRFLKEQKEAGHRLILATGADRRLALKCSAHLGMFDEVLASDGKVNLTGQAKLRAIKSALGGESFVYAGNSSADIAIWQKAEQAVPVSVSTRVMSRLRQEGVAIKRAFPSAARPFRALWRAIRPIHWTKNLLLFIPAFTAHKFFEWRTLIEILIAFVAFSLCASAAYLLNDMLDLEADRQHPDKRYRPIASGELPLRIACWAFLLLLAAGAGAARLINPAFQHLLSIYFLLAVAYSMYLKRIVLLDVLALAALYGVRIMAGGAATRIPISHWLLAFSAFLFFSLAMLKRFSELQGVQLRGQNAAKGRGYMAVDLEQLAIFGCASGYVAVLVLALYISSTHDVRALYQAPERLWLLCPCMLFWISRAWLLARRGQIEEDPILFVLKDETNWLVGVLMGLIVAWSV
jgi:4-hydroxybenzoate polyprenyltransferase